MRALDADALKKAFEDRRGTNIHYNDVIKLIDSTPTVESERPRGGWNILQKDDTGVHEIECPFCKYSKGGRFASVRVTFHELPPFCEACGAAMRGAE